MRRSGAPWWHEEAPRSSDPVAGPRLRAAREGETVRDECYACPIGSTWAALREAEPEAGDHLLAAAQELVQAARAVLDALDESIERQRRGRRGPERVQRIDVE